MRSLRDIECEYEYDLRTELDQHWIFQFTIRTSGFLKIIFRYDSRTEQDHFRIFRSESEFEDQLPIRRKIVWRSLMRAQFTFSIFISVLTIVCAINNATVPMWVGIGLLFIDMLYNHFAERVKRRASN